MKFDFHFSVIESFVFVIHADGCSSPDRRPAALTMAILGSDGGGPQVPVVIISPPLHAPITGQNSSPPQMEVALETTDSEPSPDAAPFSDITSPPVAPPIKHLQLVHGGPDRGKSSETSRRRSTGVKPFGCKTCLKSFSSSSTLRTHEKSHTQSKEFTCDTCGKAFHLRHLYLYHLRQHSGDRPHVCSICHKGFLLASQLKQHELLHTGVKPHRCEQCGKAFRTPQNYHRHLLVHTGEKPYQCAVCSRKFRQSNQLKSHMQIHTGIKLYSCERCQQGFSDSRQLKKHRCGDTAQTSLESGDKRRKQRDMFPWTDDFTSQ
uniref:C2H2-type domain-containing protein n=1 Tax=Stegastes partitus TaxID=144197 RepID=A0A3B5BLV4_9TELE